MASAQWSAELAAIADRLRAIPDVEDVVTGADGNLWIVCAPDGRRADIEGSVRAALIEGGATPDTHFELVIRAAHFQRERVRFDSIRWQECPDNQVQVKVLLEWNGEAFEGEAIGERGHAIETRTAAAATLDALEKAVDSELGVRLTGVKAVRAFDAELLVVSLHREAQRQKLVGIVVIGDDPRRAAALAVLNALNRALGNWLVRS